MGLHHVKYVLVGGGLASSSAADAIRELDPLGSIMMVGQEIVRPYYRPALSKEYLAAKLGAKNCSRIRRIGSSKSRSSFVVVVGPPILMSFAVA